MEEDALVGVFAVVVVPVEAGRGIPGGQLQRVHGDRVRHIQFARSREAAVVHFAQQHARRNPDLGLHLHPTPQGQRIQAALLDQLVEHHAQARELVERGIGHAFPGRVVLQDLSLGLVFSTTGVEYFHPIEDIGKVRGLGRDPRPLQGQFIEPDRLERRRACADSAHHHVLQATVRSAQPIEVIDVPPELLALRVSGVRGQRRVLHTVLIEHVHDRKLAAERIAPQFGRHLVELVRISLHQDRHSGLL